MFKQTQLSIIFITASTASPLINRQDIRGISVITTSLNTS
jgi:hypothetical protein